jgi:hypothetical protein
MEVEQQHRFEELKARADTTGLSSEEANELGQLYAVESGASYANATMAGNAEELDLEAKQQLEKEKQLSADQWRDMDQKRSRISFKEGGISAE